MKDTECRMRRGDGSVLEVLFSSTAHLDEAGRVIGYEGIVKDITLRKNMEQQLLQADKLASIGQLAAGVAHEINNPLGLILGYAQLLIRNSSKSGQEVEDLKTIEKQARNCKVIVQALLNFARRTETRKAPVDIHAVLNQVTDVLQRQFALDGVDILPAYCPDMPRFAGDGEKLKQVFMNLIMNARQAIEKEGEIRVSTQFDPAGNKAAITVADTGRGIEASVINRIFDPFFTTKPVGKGTGLGLSVSYGIVREHGGEIQVKSKRGKGAVFTVILPVEPDAQKEPDDRPAAEDA